MLECAPAVSMHFSKLFLGKQEAQLMLTTGSTRLAVSRGQQTWYHFGSIATFR